MNWLTTSASPPVSSKLRSKRPSPSSKIRSRATFPARREASAGPSPLATPSSTQRPAPISPATSSPTRTRCAGNPLHDSLHVALVFDDTSAVVEAAHLPWQHLGSLLINRGLLTVDQVKQAFEEQTADRQAPRRDRRRPRLGLAARTSPRRSPTRPASSTSTSRRPSPTPRRRRSSRRTWPSVTRRSRCASWATTCCSSQSPTRATSAAPTTCAWRSATTCGSPSPTLATSSARSRSSTARRSRSRRSGAELEGLFDTERPARGHPRGLRRHTGGQARARDARPVRSRTAHPTSISSRRSTTWSSAPGSTASRGRSRTIPKQMQLGVVSRLKIMGNLDIAERRAPQDGRVSIRFARQPARPAHRDHADDARRADRAPDHAPRGPQARPRRSSG